jgi:hypothetical protein
MRTAKMKNNPVTPKIIIQTIFSHLQKMGFVWH